MSYRRERKAALLALLLVLPMQLAAADDDRLIITVEVIEYDCRNSPGPVDACNAALTRAQLFMMPDFDLMDAATPRNTLSSLPIGLTDGESFSGRGCRSDSELEVDISFESPEEDRYLVEASVTFSQDAGGTHAVSTSMLVAPGEGPHLLGGSLASTEEMFEADARWVSRYQAILLSVETP